jgi:hypothetical protein
MKTGLVDLKPIYEVVKAHSRFYDSRIRPSRNPDAFRLAVKTALEQVPEVQGIYLWGTYGRSRYWRSIYLGLAGFGKTACLHDRLLKELMAGKCFLWRVCRSMEHIRDARDNGQKGRMRALRMEGATHIIWVTTPWLGNDQLHDVESDLVEALNPTANKARPAPKSHVQKDATRIYNALRKVIHAHRDSACPVSLKK